MCVFHSHQSDIMVHVKVQQGNKEMHNSSTPHAYSGYLHLKKSTLILVSIQ